MTTTPAIKTTGEVARELSVQPATLQLWVREGYMVPRSTGAGPRKRLAWAEQDVARARRMRDRNGSSPLVAVFGPELAAAAAEAWKLRDFRGDGDAVVAGPERGRIFRVDATIQQVASRLTGDFLIILR